MPMLGLNGRALRLGLGLAVLSLTGCEVWQDKRGFVISSSDFGAIEKGIGRLTQKEIAHRLGPPTYVFSFDPNAWHYLSECIERQAFFYPKVVEAKAYVLRFDANAVLQSIETSKGPVDVEISSQETLLPSSHGTEILKQMFHKFGKFPTTMQKESSAP